MGKLLFVLFTLVPVVEIALLVKLGGLMGFWPTVSLVILTGIAGAALARSEGTKVITEWQKAMNEMRLPAEGVLSGLLVLVGGVLLVTPGVLTDVLGFSLLIPASRRVIARQVRRVVKARWAVAGSSAGAGFSAYSHVWGAAGPQAGPGDVVDGEIVDDAPGVGEDVPAAEPERVEVIDVR